jgi:hypothetical protein
MMLKAEPPRKTIPNNAPAKTHVNTIAAMANVFMGRCERVRDLLILSCSRLGPAVSLAEWNRFKQSRAANLHAPAAQLRRKTWP